MDPGPSSFVVREISAPPETIKHLIKDSLIKHASGEKGCPKKRMFKIWGKSKRINLVKHKATIEAQLSALKEKGVLIESETHFKMLVSFTLLN